MKSVQIENFCPYFIWLIRMFEFLNIHFRNVLSRNVIQSLRLHKDGNKKIRRFVLRDDRKGNGNLVDYLHLVFA